MNFASHYDYVVVGGGVAGCIVAHELMQRGVGTVLLVESSGLPVGSSGGRDIPQQDYPIPYLRSFGTDLDWKYRTVPQPHASHRCIALPSGRAFGGSSAINAMIWIEPHASDWSTWEQIAGEDWRSDACAQEMGATRKWLRTHWPEKSRSASAPNVPKLHPNMQRWLEQSATHKWCIHEYASGFQNAQNGIAPYKRMQHVARRITLWSLLFDSKIQRSEGGRSRLSIATGVDAHRILVDSQRATGIELRLGHGSLETVQANRGVVVCAGAFGTPRILTQSGFGARDALNALGIPMRAELPMLGRSVQDHLVLPVIFRSESPPTGTWSRADWESSNLAELGAFHSWTATPFMTDPSLPIDVQWHITPTHYLDPDPANSPTSHVSIGITPFGLKGKGHLEFGQRHDGDPKGPLPIAIDPGYLSHDEDIELVVRALSWARQCVATASWSDWLRGEVFPKTEDPMRLRSAVRKWISTIYHYSCTCGMGTDPASCLDPHFRVRGVEDLWVCDASAMPQLVRCNPQATIAMMARRCVDWMV